MSRGDSRPLTKALVFPLILIDTVPQARFNALIESGQRHARVLTVNIFIGETVVQHKPTRYPLSETENSQGSRATDHIAGEGRRKAGNTHKRAVLARIDI